MNKFALAAIAGSILITSAAANAASFYENDFDLENNGVTAPNYNGFTGATVARGTVNLIQVGSGNTNGFTCAAGTGGCIEMGDTSDFVNSLVFDSFNFAANSVYQMSFELSGQAPSSVSGLNAEVIFDADVTLNFFRIGQLGGTGFVDIYQGQTFAPTGAGSLFLALGNPTFRTGYIAFSAQNAGTANFRLRTLQFSGPAGVVVDNVVLSSGAVPEPASWALLIAGFGLVGAAARRRRLSAAA